MKKTTEEYTCNVCGVTESDQPDYDIMWAVCIDSCERLQHFCKENSKSHHVCEQCFRSAESLGLSILLGAKIDVTAFADIGCPVHDG